MTDVVAGGIRFNVHLMGQGDRVAVFVHGLIVDNLASWYFSIAPEVAKHCTTLLYDLRGHGRSDQPLTGYSVDAMAGDLAAILDEMKLSQRPLTLIGNSTGGMVVLRYALRYPEHVESLVLVDSHTGRPDFGQRMASTLELTGDDRTRKMMELFGNWVDDHTEDGQPDADVQATMKLFRRVGSRQRNPLAAVAERLVLETSLITDLRDTEPITEDELRAIHCPVLALYGEKSDLRVEGERLAAMLPWCELELVAGCTHGIIWQGTTLLRERLGRWMDELQPS